MNDVLIIGIGNPYRGDDGAGLAVIDALQGNTSPHVTLKKERGDIALLIDLFSKHNTVYLVDACQGIPSWKRFDLNKEELTPETNLTSTHGFSITQAVALAKTLGKLPTNLFLYVIPGTNFSMTENLSSPVQCAVTAVSHALLQELT